MMWKDIYTDYVPISKNAYLYCETMYGVAFIVESYMLERDLFKFTSKQIHGCNWVSDSKILRSVDNWN